MPVSYTLPDSCELEISLFGPGTGESIVVHLGENQWMIIDSCLNRSTNKAAPIEYLNAIGVDPATSVSVIIITHFHSDHISGIEQVLHACENAEVFITGALLSDEAYTYVASFAPDFDITDTKLPGTRAFKKVLSAISEKEIVPREANEGQIAFRRNNVEAVCLSPSAAACHQARLDFSKKYTEVQGKPFRQIADRKLSENLCAVAIHIEFPFGSILLGSDLEHSSKSNLGWEAVLSSTLFSPKKASIFKVPHHGSETGHHDEIVSKLLEPKPISILTTMNSSNLPTADDVSRIKSYSGSLYSTTPPKAKPPKRERAAEEALKAVAKKRQVLPKAPPGHIQVRLTKENTVVAMNEAATQL